MSLKIGKIFLTIFLIISIGLNSAEAKPKRNSAYDIPKPIVVSKLTRDEKALLKQANTHINNAKRSGFETIQWNFENSAGEYHDFLVKMLTGAGIAAGSLLLIPGGSLVGSMMLPLIPIAIATGTGINKSLTAGTRYYIYKLKIIKNTAKVWHVQVDHKFELNEPVTYHIQNLLHFVKEDGKWKFTDIQPRIVKSITTYPNNPSKNRVVINPNNTPLGTSI